MIDSAAPPIEAKHDRWCVNCARMVAPKLSVPPVNYLTGILAYFIAPNLLAHLGVPVDAWLGSSAWLSPAIGAALVVGVPSAIWPDRSCPICKTKNLKQPTPPAA